MTIQSIERAVQEAERFLAAVKRLEVYPLSSPIYATWEKRGDQHKRIEPGRATGAVRRASLDATRALAEMRKP